jgi:site-specific recombinase XerD
MRNDDSHHGTDAHAGVGSVVVLMRFLHKYGLVDAPPPSLPSNPIDVHVNAVIAYLDEVRGYAPSTIRQQRQIAVEFLRWLRFPDNPQRLSSVVITDLEGFIHHLGKRMGRVGFQKPIAIMRNFLRFLAAEGPSPWDSMA